MADRMGIGKRFFGGLDMNDENPPFVTLMQTGSHSESYIHCLKHGYRRLVYDPGPSSLGCEECLYAKRR